MHPYDAVARLFMNFRPTGSTSAAARRLQEHEPAPVVDRVHQPDLDSTLEPDRPDPLAAQGDLLKAEDVLDARSYARLGLVAGCSRLVKGLFRRPLR